MMLHIQNKEIKINKILFIIAAAILLIIIILIATPKNKNRIVCTKKDSINTANFTEVYIGFFKENKLKTLVVDFENEQKNNDDDKINSMYNYYSKQLNKLKSKGGYEYTITKNKNSVKFRSTIDVNKIPDETKNKVGFNGDWEYNAFKKNLEDNGFICK